MSVHVWLGGVHDFADLRRRPCRDALLSAIRLCLGPLLLDRWWRDLATVERRRHQPPHVTAPAEPGTDHDRVFFCGVNATLGGGDTGGAKDFLGGVALGEVGQPPPLADV